MNPNGTLTVASNYNPLNGLVRDGVNGTPQDFSNYHNWYWMPMVGFAYDIFGDGTTALRGGYGINYEKALASTDCTWLCASNPPDVQTITLNHPSFPNPVGTGTQAPLSAIAMSTQSPQLQAAEVQTFSINLDRQIKRTWVASVGIVGDYASHLQHERNINQPMPVPGYNFNPAINTGTSAYQNAPYLGYASMTDFVSDASAIWYGLVGSLRHAFSSNFL